MYAQVAKSKENKSRAVANSVTQKKGKAKEGFGFVDNRPETIARRKQQLQTNYSSSLPIQKKGNNTGLPDNLKRGIENLSGYSMDDVKVHYNSNKPAQFQAHANAKSTDIHLASGQDQHLHYDRWHVVQQKQGWVQVTKQLQGKVEVNDNQGLKQEVEVIVAKSLQTKNDGSLGKMSKTHSLAHGAGVMQLFRLKLGISGASTSVGISADDLPNTTYVWILSNKKADADALDGNGVTSGQNKSTPQEIIKANEVNVKTPIYYNVGGHRMGLHLKGIFQSGQFLVPRGGDQAGIDYSFLRFAAIESYKLWYASEGKSKLWPDITSDGTMVETIDSDFSGITTDTGTAANENKKTDGSWLAEAGVYKWNWQDVKDNESVNAPFTNEGIVNNIERDTALKQFAEVYFKAEVAKRDAASSDIFQIYFPEPATRLSSYAIDLLSGSGFQNMKITRGNQLGYGRESIGLIAGLAYLDQKSTQKDESRSKKKLKYNSGYVVPTDLGKRKASFISLFINWHNKIKLGSSRTDVAVFNDLSGIDSFDQSYLNPGLPNQIKTWHNNTLTEMKKKDKDAQTFFHPKA